MIHLVAVVAAMVAVAVAVVVVVVDAAVVAVDAEVNKDKVVMNGKLMIRSTRFVFVFKKEAYFDDRNNVCGFVF